MSDIHSKVLPLNDLASLAEALKLQGKKLILCHGVFDLLHLGHIRHLSSAKKHGDVLVVSTTADRYVKRGPGRPVFNEQFRAEALAALSVTDFVTISDSSTALEAIRLIRPHLYVKGPDYKNRRTDGSSKLQEEIDAVHAGGGDILYTDDVTFSSSQLINNHFNSLPQPATDYLKQLAGKYSIDVIRDYVGEAKKLKILVIGDTIIDQYCYCKPLGKASKDNFVTNKYLYEESYAGGILATANHVAQLSDSVELITFLGDQHSHANLLKAHLDPKINLTTLTRLGCSTTIKRRFVTVDDNRKVFEVCHIDDQPLSNEEEQQLLSRLDGRLAQFDLILVNDFGHGMLTSKVRTLLTDQARCLALNVQTNSANHGFNLITNYPRADFICIDEIEARLATRDKHRSVKELIPELLTSLHAKHIVVTRGSKGSLSFTEENEFVESPALTTFGVDKIGAGDAFFAFTSPCFAAGVPSELIDFIGNVAGALKLQIIGNKEAVKWSDTLKFMTRLLKV